MTASNTPSPRPQDHWSAYEPLAASLADLLLLCVVAGLMVLAADRWAPPQHLPWRPLNLEDPVGLFTRAKLSGAEGGNCRAVLDRGGLAFSDAPTQTSGSFCSIQDAIRLGSGSRLQRPAAAVMTCNTALAFSIWERQVVEPAALEALGAPLAGIEHYGTYSCRRQYGASTGRVSQHASANAIDIAAFLLADGRRVSVARDWNDRDDKGEFLRRVRDGACDVFDVTLSPDYNRQHADHLHLDMGRGPFCR